MRKMFGKRIPRETKLTTGSDADYSVLIHALCGERDSVLRSDSWNEPTEQAHLERINDLINNLQANRRY